MFTPITRWVIDTLTCLRCLAEYWKATALRKLGFRALTPLPAVQTSEKGSTQLKRFSQLSDRRCMSSNRETVPRNSIVFTDLLAAVQSDNPAEALAALLKAHEGQPYYSDLQAKAKTLLYVRSQGNK